MMLVNPNFDTEFRPWVILTYDRDSRQTLEDLYSYSGATGLSKNQYETMHHTPYNLLLWIVHTAHFAPNVKTVRESQRCQEHLTRWSPFRFHPRILQQVRTVIVH